MTLRAARTTKTARMTRTSRGGTARGRTARGDADDLTENGEDDADSGEVACERKRGKPEAAGENNDDEDDNDKDGEDGRSPIGSQAR